MFQELNRSEKKGTFYSHCSPDCRCLCSKFPNGGTFPKSNSRKSSRQKAIHKKARQRINDKFTYSDNNTNSEQPSILSSQTLSPCPIASPSHVSVSFQQCTSVHTGSISDVVWWLTTRIPETKCTMVVRVPETVVGIPLTTRVAGAGETYTAFGSWFGWSICHHIVPRAV